MLRSAKDLQQYAVEAEDGPVGWMNSMLVKDDDWSLEYMVVNLGNWLPGREVLVPPERVVARDWTHKRLKMDATKEKIEHSPGIEEHRPVSAQKETDQILFHSWPVTEKMGDPHLRSTRELIGYKVNARDGRAGRVEDFIVEDGPQGRVRYVVVNTGDILPGKRVMLSVDWIDHIKWSDKIVFIDMTKERIDEAPEYDPREPVNREYETRVYDYYGRPKYWELS